MKKFSLAKLNRLRRLFWFFSVDVFRHVPIWEQPIALGMQPVPCFIQLREARLPPIGKRRPVAFVLGVQIANSPIERGAIFYFAAIAALGNE